MYSPTGCKFDNIWKITVTALVILLTAMGSLSCSPEGGDHPFDPPPSEDERPWVLVDLRHTQIQNPVDYRLHRDQFNYQGTYGFHRLFEHLEIHDYPWRATDEKLLDYRLEHFDILFINLIHDRMPDFTNAEIKAIKQFVHDGGGLFVIGDHTNVYRHAERINPFLQPMGIEMMYHTAVDHPPVNSVSGKGWIMSFDFSEHPINEDVRMISFKTGGPVKSQDPSDDLAFTSEDGFADYWDESNEGGFYGDWRQGEDEELEPSGPLSIAAATEYGDGRAVLVGDQNIFGDAWLHVGDNFEFALNGFDWLAGNEQTDQLLRDQPPKGHNIAFESDVNYYQTVRNDSLGHGYYYAFIESNRNENVTARATTELDTGHTDTLFFPSSDIHFGNEKLDDRYYTDAQLDEVADFLDSGGQVVISFDTPDIPEPTIQLLDRLTDNFAIDIGGQIWEPGDDDIPDPDKFDGFHDLVSAQLDVDGLGMAALAPRQFPSTDDYRDEAQSYTEDDFDFYLYDLRAISGEPFVEARVDDDVYVTIAQRKTIGDGELIIFVQDGFWRNRTLGSDELLEPKSFFRTDIVEFHHEFLDYLRGD